VVDQLFQQPILEVARVQTMLAFREQIDDRLEAALEHRLVERLLAREVVVDAGLVEAHLAGDLAHRDAGEAALREQGFGRIEDPRGGAPALGRDGLGSWT
jgi:hypothetical protein